MTSTCLSASSPFVPTAASAGARRSDWPRRLREALLDTFAPRGCVACDAEVLVTPARPFCASCAPAAEGDGVHAPYRYGGSVRDAIVRLKFVGRTDLGEPLGRTLGAWARRHRHIDAHAVVVPVASSAARIRERGYCHATLLARGVAQELALRLDPFGLVRVHQEGRQLGRTRDERRTSLRGAYASSGKMRGKSVVLVDDVRTTGATMDAAMAALREVGAARVLPLVVAFTQDDPMP
jgi:predicted amidophosphoribosyltransferase